MVFGTVTEGAMNDWSALYMKDVAKASAELAPMGIAVVSVMMVLARVFADGWRSRWGDDRIVRTGSALAAAGLALALLSGGVAPALIGFACVGLGIAAVTPCVYVAAAKNGSDALTVVATMGTTGLLAGPPVIGFIANASGLVGAWGRSPPRRAWSPCAAPGSAGRPRRREAYGYGYGYARRTKSGAAYGSSARDVHPLGADDRQQPQRLLRRVSRAWRCRSPPAGPGRRCRAHRS